MTSPRLSSSPRLRAADRSPQNSILGVAAALTLAQATFGCAARSAATMTADPSSLAAAELSSPSDKDVLNAFGVDQTCTAVMKIDKGPRSVGAVVVDTATLNCGDVLGQVDAVRECIEPGWGTDGKFIGCHSGWQVGLTSNRGKFRFIVLPDKEVLKNSTTAQVE